jgi:uncharacterized protein (TIGR03437 family)
LVRGHLSDIAVDAKRGVLYAANFTFNQIEVLSLASGQLQNPILVGPQPSALAVSPDGKFLVVGLYGSQSPAPALMIVNLDTLARQTISLGSDSVLAAAFGNGTKALIVTTGGVSLLDPIAGTLTRPILGGFDSTPLPVPWATFPAGIISGTAGVSGDGNVIYVLIDEGTKSDVIRYNVADGSVLLTGSISSPPLGPRVVSVDRTGTTFVAGWTLLTLHNSDLANLAQFPYAPGVLYQGGHAFDSRSNLIYAQIAPGAIQLSPGTAGAPAFLQVFDADNLTVRETFRLRENLAGKALLSGDNMYAISDSGLTVFPTGALSKVHRVKALQEDLLFQSNGCNQGVISQYLDVIDPGGNATDFTLTSSSPGVTFSSISGTTPARVQVLVDPTVFQDQKGTASVSVQITSASAVNIAAPVRVLINTRNPDQQGAIHDVPGTIVDVLPDPARDRFYVLRQDQNQVIAFDGTSMSQIAVLRTGNTPVQMAISQDQLLVTNDNSQIVNVFDLATLTATAPVFLPGGFYARSIAAASGSILTTTRPAGGTPEILTIDLASRVANEAWTYIYRNEIDANSALAASPSGRSIFMVMPGGTVALYDTGATIFVASRSDIGAVSGAYAALSDTAYMAGNTVFGPSLVPQGQVNLLGGVSSGAAANMIDGRPLLSSAPAGGRSGVIQRFSMDPMDQFASIFPVRTAEASGLAPAMTHIPLGQTGQTILPFTRTLAPLGNGQTIVQLSTSGFIAVPMSFDAPLPPPATIQAVTNAADLGPNVAPGGLITIWGSGFSDGNATAQALPLDNGLNNVCLYANSVPVPLLFVSPNQINAQLPFNLSGAANLVLANAGGTGAPFSFTIQPAAPAVFRSADGAPILIRTIDNKLVTNATPIHLNQTFTIYLTGLGAVSPGVTAGIGAPGDSLASTTVVPRVYLGATQLFTLWSGLAPGFAGLYQINVQVPFKEVSTGSKVQLAIIQGSAQTQMMVPVAP